MAFAVELLAARVHILWWRSRQRIELLRVLMRYPAEADIGTRHVPSPSISLQIAATN